MKTFPFALVLMLSIFSYVKGYSCQSPNVTLNFPETICFGEETTVKVNIHTGCQPSCAAFILLPPSCKPASSNLEENTTGSEGTVYSLLRDEPLYPTTGDRTTWSDDIAEIKIVVEKSLTVFDESIETSHLIHGGRLSIDKTYPLSELQFCTTETTRPALANANMVSYGYCGGHNTSNYGAATEITASYTPGGYCSTDRKTYGLLKMEMPEIPAGAIIQSATLSLTPSVNTGSNDAKLSLVTSDWDESTVIYDTKPNVSSTNTVAVPHENGLATRELDISAMVEYWRQRPDKNYGVRLSLQDESGSEKELSFYSSNSENAEYHPKLSITYTNNNANMLGAVGDAQINNSTYCNGTNTNRNDHMNELFYASYTPGQYCFSGGYTKGLMKFDFSNVDPSIEIQSASLILTTESSLGNRPCAFKKITSAWDQTTVTWDNQPTTTSSGEQNILWFHPNVKIQLNITSWVESWLADPSSNFGFMLELSGEETEETKMSFYSSNSLIPENHPKIVLNLKSGSIVVREYPSAQTERDDSSIGVSVYPNPTSGSISVKSKQEIETVAVFNSTGMLVFKTATEGTDTSIDLSDLPEGAYTVQVSTTQETINETIMLQK